MQSNRPKAVYGGFFVRMSAFMIDSLIAGILSLIASFPISAICRALPGDLGNQAVLFQYTGKDILHYLVWTGYFVLFTYATGKTLGKRAMNLRVINADGSLQLSLINVIFRETVGRFLCSVIAGIGYLLVGADTEKRGLHDRICDTRVVYEKTIPVRYKYSGVQERPEGGYVPKLQPESEVRFGQELRPESEVQTEKGRQPESELKFEQALQPKSEVQLGMEGQLQTEGAMEKSEENSSENQ